MSMGYRNYAYATRTCQNYKLDKESDTSANFGMAKYREINNSPISEEFPARCRWFTRGWTLQELIAPAAVKSHDQGWTFFLLNTI